MQASMPPHPGHCGRESAFRFALCPEFCAPDPVREKDGARLFRMRALTAPLMRLPPIRVWNDIGLLAMSTEPTPPVATVRDNHYLARSL